MKKRTAHAAALAMIATAAILGATATALAGGWLDPIQATWTDTNATHTVTNGITRYWISSVWVESSTSVTMTVAVVHNNYTNQIIGSTTGTVASFQEPYVLTVEPYGRIVIEDGLTETNTLKMTVYRGPATP